MITVRGDLTFRHKLDRSKQFSTLGISGQASCLRLRGAVTIPVLAEVAFPQKNGIV
jgi:hypothetical protein